MGLAADVERQLAGHVVRKSIGERTSQRWPTRPGVTAEPVAIGEGFSHARRENGRAGGLGPSSGCSPPHPVCRAAVRGLGTAMRPGCRLAVAAQCRAKLRGAPVRSLAWPSIALPCRSRRPTSLFAGVVMAPCRRPGRALPLPGARKRLQRGQVTLVIVRTLVVQRSPDLLADGTREHVQDLCRS